MKPTSFAESNVVFAKDQPEYQPLPAHQSGDETISCWSLTFRERLRVLFSGRLWLRQLNFRQPLQPQLPQVSSPFDVGAPPREGTPNE